MDIFLIFALSGTIAFLFIQVMRADGKLRAVEDAWRKREEEWRRRQLETEDIARKEVRDLLDRYLVKQHVEPLQIHNKKVVTIDNDPTPDLSPIDLAMRADEVLEELELLHPEVRGMHYEDARRLYRDEWRIIEQQLEADRKPFYNE